jgi:tetratricopeptide (TPR) repeat protein
MNNASDAETSPLIPGGPRAGGAAPGGEAASRGLFGAAGTVAAGLLIVLLVAVAWWRALAAPFVFDDVAAIVENPSLRTWRTAFFPPADRGLPVTGRPLVNASLALDRAWSGANPRGYHATNLALHALAALVLFALVRRTLCGARAAGAERGLVPVGGHAATLAAFCAALAWSLHPLQTAAVSYVSQRSEVLMAVFYLATLYGFARGARAQDAARAARTEAKGNPRAGAGWLVFSIVACAAGMATKEVMVSAPLLVLLYDRTFGAGTFRAALRRRWPVHLALAATWLLLGWLMWTARGRAGTAGFGLGISPWHYALTQCQAIVHYLRLALWPDALVFDYGGTVLVRDWTAVWPQGIFLLALLGLTLAALVRRPAAGFCGAFFFAVLAPTSSFVPVADTMFEHRMYLPLAALGVAALALGALTVARNAVFRSELALWRDVAAKRPASVRAHYTLGSVLAGEGRLEEAIACYERALALDPRAAQAHNNLANVFVKLGRLDEAVAHYLAALQAQPSAEAHNNLGNVLFRLGRGAEARAQFEAALARRPAFAEPHNNLGNLCAQAGDFAGAERHYTAALRSRPDLADAHANLANVLAQTGRAEAALAHYEAALRLRPEFLAARMNFATALTELRRWDEARAQLEAVLQAQPGHPAARALLAEVEALRAALGK